MSVEGPIYSFDTVVARGTGCDPGFLAAVKLVMWPGQAPPPIELQPLGSPQAAVQPDGTVAVTFAVPLLAAGNYGATLVCNGSPSAAHTTAVNVVAGFPPAASLAVTSPVPAGGSGVLTAQHCGRSAHGEIQASVRVLGAMASFSFSGTTRADGGVEQHFTVPANAPAGAYRVELSCGRNSASQVASGQLVVS